MACSGSYHLTKPMLSQLIQVPFTVGYEVDTANPSKLICLSFTFRHLLLCIIWKNFLVFLIAALSLSFLRACLSSAPSLYLTRAAAFGDTSASWDFSQATLPWTPNQHSKTLCSRPPSAPLTCLFMYYYFKTEPQGICYFHSVMVSGMAYVEF